MMTELFNKFDRMRNELPEKNSIISSIDGENIRLTIDKRDDLTNVYCNAVIKTKNNDCSWQLVNEQTGLKCLIFPRAQERLIQKFGDLSKAVVQKLRVVAYNKKLTAVLCEEVTDE